MPTFETDVTFSSKELWARMPWVRKRRHMIKELNFKAPTN